MIELCKWILANEDSEVMKCSKNYSRSFNFNMVMKITIVEISVECYI